MCNATPTTSIATYFMPSSRTMTSGGLVCIVLTSTSLLSACSSDVTNRGPVQKERSNRQYSQETMSLTPGTPRRLGHSGKGLLIWRKCLELASKRILFTSRKYHESNKRDFVRASLMARCNNEQNSTFTCTFGFLRSHPVTLVQD